MKGMEFFIDFVGESKDINECVEWIEDFFWMYFIRYDFLFCKFKIFVVLLFVFFYLIL